MLELLGFIPLVIIAFHHFTYLIILSSTRRFEKPLWRVLRPEEKPEAGLEAKDPGAKNTVISHVNLGGRKNYKSQYISTTASYDVAHKYAKKDGLRIAEIDLYALPKSCKLKIWDLTIEKNRDKWLKNSDRLKNYANASCEVLLKCNVRIPCRLVDPLGILWRILWPDEDPEFGLTAKNPKASETVSSHVQYECQKEYRSQYISTTASYAVVVRDYERKRMKEGAKKENEGLTRPRIAKIDLNALRKSYKLKLVDLRTKENREKYLNGADEWKNIARASCMVLLKCNVPIPCHVIDPPE